MARVARHLVVHGVVQGVGFRWSAAREAARLGVAGWVRNRSDGDVEAVVEGEQDAVGAFVGWARQGPRGSAVTSVDVTDQPPGQRASFEIEH